MTDECKVPPTGWYCTRGAGHEGPCAAHPESAREIAAQPGEGEPVGYLDGLDHLETSGYATLWKRRLPGHGDIPLIPVYASPPHVADALDGERYRLLRDHVANEYNSEKGYIRWYLTRTGRGFKSLDDHLDSIIAARAEAGGSERDQFSKCDNCGSGVWNTEWDPECRERKSKKFYCPNCTGATP